MGQQCLSCLTQRVLPTIADFIHYGNDITYRSSFPIPNHPRVEGDCGEVSGAFTEQSCLAAG
jgi:hypothetical protein